jgi:hypothetical protein
MQDNVSSFLSKFDYIKLQARNYNSHPIRIFKYCAGLTVNGIKFRITYHITDDSFHISNSSTDYTPDDIMTDFERANFLYSTYRNF